MINHNNIGQMQSRNMSRLIIANVNNKDEAMMFNVPKGYTAYLFEYHRTMFYVKSCDEFTGQVSFFEYEYNEIVPQPVQDSSNFVTRDDMVNFKNDIMDSISTLLSNYQGGMNNEQRVPKTDAKSARTTKGQSR